MNKNLNKWLVKGYLKYLGDPDFIAVVSSGEINITARLLHQILGSISVASLIEGKLMNIDKTLLKIKKGVGLVILSISLENEDDWKLLTDFVKPSMIILPEISNIPEGFSGNKENYLASLKNVLNCLKVGGVIIANGNDEDCLMLTKNVNAEVFLYGREKEYGLWVSNQKIEGLQMTYELNMGVERVEIYSPTVGFHLINFQMAASAGGLYLGLPLTSIKNVLELTTGINGVMQILSGIHGSVLINDVQENSLESLEGGLETLDAMTARKRILISSGVKQISDSAKIHQRLARKIFKQNLDYCFFLGKEGKIISEELLSLGFPAERVEDDLMPVQIGNKLTRLLTRGDVVLIRGNTDLGIADMLQKLIKE